MNLHLESVEIAVVVVPANYAVVVSAVGSVLISTDVTVFGLNDSALYAANDASLSYEFSMLTAKPEENYTCCQLMTVVMRVLRVINANLASG